MTKSEKGKDVEAEITEEAIEESTGSSKDTEAVKITDTKEIITPAKPFVPTPANANH